MVKLSFFNVPEGVNIFQGGGGGGSNLVKPVISKLPRLVGFVALRPKSTAMVIAGRSVHLTTLFPGQA